MSQAMTTNAIKQLGAEFHHAADGVGEALRRLERARLDRLAFLRRRSKDSTARLAAIKEELRTLPEQIAKWDAEAAHLEAQTGLDLLRAVVAETPTSGELVYAAKPPGQVLVDGKSEDPFVPGLPPERLRKVWAEWEDEEGDVVTFKDEHYHWSNWRASMPVKRIHDFAWIGLKLKPLGRSWAEVEAMVDEAEKPAEPKMLDLRELPVGTVCEAIASLLIPRRDLAFAAGQRFTIDGFDASALPVRALFDGSEWWLPALVPARVVKEGGEQ